MTETRYMFLKKGADAIHKLGNIKRDTYDAELIIVHKENETEYIGNFADGFGFINVVYKKEDCRLATDAEVEMCRKGKMEEIKF